ncbi:MAG: chemotaxis protein CheA [Thermoplasmata archaeon]|nr:chemotaxis protein CheA [Thermoplasmata archaeon]
MTRSKYLDLFVEEAGEHLQALNSLLLEMEKDQYNEERMNETYRLVHTIKGTASVLGIEEMPELAHTMEYLFDMLREKKEKPKEDTINLLFESVDMMNAMLQELTTTGSIETSGKELVQKLKNTYASDNTATETGQTRSRGELVLISQQKNQLMDAISKGQNVYEINIIFNADARLKEGRVFQLLRNLSPLGYVIASNPDTKNIDDSIKEMKILFATREDQDRITQAAEGITGIEHTTIQSYKATTAKTDNKNKLQGPNIMTKTETIRIKSRHLDGLLDLVGEIMISNIRVKQIAEDSKNRELNQVLKNSERLIGELQDSVLRMRLVHIDNIFKRFPRMVRDMARESGKEIEFNIKGNDMEIDQGLLDEIGDVLVHALRNAVDHGIETREERIKRGKPPEGVITLSAYREQSNIVVAVEDNGQGITTAKIVESAISKGLVTPEKGKEMNEKKALSLIFLPGFSTATNVTEISGRGVGLDVVKTKIEKLGGTVKLDTTPEKGTKLTMRLPPSISIIKAMLVEVNQEKYAIPLENVRETINIPLAQIHDIMENGIFRLREEIIPILNIHKEFGGYIEPSTTDMPAVMVEKDDERVGLIVTKLVGQQEIVVKNLGKEMRKTQYFSGATILGDGRVAMILDVGAFI